MKRNAIILLLLTLSFGLFAQPRGLMFLGSLAVPGLTQVSQGKKHGYIMLASEAAIIGGMMYANNEEKLAQREAYEFAIKYAHIQPGAYSEIYFRDLSRYNSGGFEADGYNTKILKQAMALYPNNPDKQQEYLNEHAYPEELYWIWDSTAQRAAYSKIRIKASKMRDYSKAAVGVLIVNHLVSGFDALRITSPKRRSQVYMSLKGKDPLLNVSYRF
ncbi:MAG TPA: hypothetical protein GX398_05775 [Candidatus Cloacimonetes bacterium]|jgi:hypothetical protein|nr:hypothetical protein [Candidatus Cloacimonadota bacterium]